jgi:hypothetical protein
MMELKSEEEILLTKRKKKIKEMGESYFRQGSNRKIVKKKLIQFKVVILEDSALFS